MGAENEGVEGKDTLGDIMQGYLDRAVSLKRHVKDHPWSLLDPFETVNRMMPTWENEPGRENRIFVGQGPDSRGIYVRFPGGKIGEEFKDWLTHPGEMLTRKESTLLRPLIQGITNDKGFGAPIYLDDDNVGKKAGAVVWHWMKSQTPAAAGEGVADYFSGTPEGDVALWKAFGPLLGLSVSRGAPPNAEASGPEAGVDYAELRRREQIQRMYFPEIDTLARRGTLDEARDLMTEKMPWMKPGEITKAINRRAEGMRSNYATRRAQRGADEDYQERRERVRQ